METESHKGVTRQVHFVPTSLEYISDDVSDGRVGKIFSHSGADKVYILYNSNPKGHELHKKSLAAVEDVVREYTMAHQRGGIQEIGVNFFDFTNAVADIYEKMYKEEQNNNQITIHISGGTKLVSMALAFASALLDSSEVDVYYVAKRYELKEGEPTSTGLIDEIFPVSPLDKMNVANIIPNDEEKRTIIRGLFENQEVDNFKGMLREQGVFDASDDSESSIYGKYHRHKEALIEANQVTKDGGETSLTPTGELIGHIMTKREKIDNQN